MITINDLTPLIRTALDQLGIDPQAGKRLDLGPVALTWLDTDRLSVTLGAVWI